MAERKLVQIRSVLTRPMEATLTGDADQIVKDYGFDEETAKALVKVSTSRGRNNILSDLPTREDSLGFTPLIRTLCNIVLSRSTETPVTIAVDGRWGSGKTSILRMVEAQARLVGFSCIWLNAWSLESAENLIAAVAREIQQELVKRDKTSETTSGKLFNFIVNALGYLAPLVDPGGGNRAGALLRALNLKGATQTIETNVQEVASIVSSQQAFQDLVKLLVETKDGAGHRLLVFIDDVDRALPDQVAIVLKNLKLILESDNCIFLLAMDMDLVAVAVEEHYRKNAAGGSIILNAENIGTATITGTASPYSAIPTFGYRYLEKLVQLRVSVPGLSRSNLRPFLETLSIAPEISEIVAWAPEEETLNPRRLKRFINWLSLTLQLLSAIRVPPQLDTLSILQLLMFRRYYPSFYAKLSNPNLRYGDLISHWRTTIGELPDASDESFWEFMAPLADTNLADALRFISDSPLLETASPATTSQRHTVQEAAPNAVSRSSWHAAEKTEFTVVLRDGGDKKINVIKEVRAITGLGIKEAKDLVEGAPKEVKADVSKDEAAKIKKQLEDAGARVEIL